MSMEQWWNVTDSENWNTGREKLYSLCGRWMNVYGALVVWHWQGETEVLVGKHCIVWVVGEDGYVGMVEWYCQEEAEVLGGKHYIVWVLGEWMGMERWWNGTGRGNLSFERKTIYSVGGRWRCVGSNGGMVLREGNWSTGRKIFYSVGGSWRCVWSNGGKLLTVVNWSTGKETLYSVGGRFRWLWSNGGMVLTEGNWITGRETLYSVCGRWMNGYGALVEWYWQGKTEVLGEKYYLAWVVGEWMGMEFWWNGTDKGKLK